MVTVRRLLSSGNFGNDKSPSSAENGLKASKLKGTEHFKYAILYLEPPIVSRIAIKKKVWYTPIFFTTFRTAQLNQR